jgi:hypothetical protein
LKNKSGNFYPNSRQDSFREGENDTTITDEKWLIGGLEF